MQTKNVNVANLSWHFDPSTSTVREKLLKQKPVTIWLTGLSGAGKSTIAYALEKELLSLGRCCYVLDGDHLRHHLNRDLGFSADDRKENIRRVAEVAHLMNEAGLIVIAAFISPYRVDRKMAQDIISSERFIEVHVSTSTEICEARDPKGLYAKAREGKIPEFTGISSPYEAPVKPTLSLNTESVSVSATANLLRDHLLEQGYLL